MNKLQIVFVILILSAASLACGSSTIKATATVQKETQSPVPTETSEAAELPPIPAGELQDILSEYEGEITKWTVINVYKLDGTLDEREDDLKQLCLDWFFYRDRIIRFEAEGKSSEAEDARETWNMINLWLDDYHVDDTGFMFSLIESEGW